MLRFLSSIPSLCVVILLSGCASMPRVQPWPTNPQIANPSGVFYTLPRAEIILQLPVVQTLHTPGGLLPAEADRKAYLDELNTTLGIQENEIVLKEYNTYALDHKNVSLETRSLDDPAAVFYVPLVSGPVMETKFTLTFGDRLVLSGADNTVTNTTVATALKIVDTAVLIAAKTAFAASAVHPVRVKGSHTPAVNEVLRLRALRRAFLEKGAPQHTAGQLELALTWLDQEEARWLAQLKGSTSTKTWNARARFIPPSDCTEPKIVAWIHPTRGFRMIDDHDNALNPFDDTAPPDDAKLSRISISVTPQGDVVSLLPSGSQAQEDCSYAYRIPMPCLIQAQAGTSEKQGVFAQREALIPQLGLIRYLPRRIRGFSGTLNFTLNPDTGALVKITSESKPVDAAAIAAAVGTNAKTLLDADDELARLTRKQKILEARAAIKAAEDAEK